MSKGNKKMINNNERKGIIWKSAKLAFGILSIAAASHVATAYYNEKKKEREVREVIDGLMRNELVEKDYWYHGAVDCIASHNSEIRAAFMSGRADGSDTIYSGSKPYYSTPAELEGAAKDGLETRRKLEARVRGTGGNSNGQ